MAGTAPRAPALSKNTRLGGDGGLVLLVLHAAEGGAQVAVLVRSLQLPLRALERVHLVHREADLRACMYLTGAASQTGHADDDEAAGPDGVLTFSSPAPFANIVRALGSRRIARCTAERADWWPPAAAHSKSSIASFSRAPGGQTSAV